MYPNRITVRGTVNETDPHKSNTFLSVKIKHSTVSTGLCQRHRKIKKHKKQENAAHSISVQHQHQRQTTSSLKCYSKELTVALVQSSIYRGTKSKWQVRALEDSTGFSAAISSGKALRTTDSSLVRKVTWKASRLKWELYEFHTTP